MLSPIGKCKHVPFRWRILHIQERSLSLPSSACIICMQQSRVSLVSIPEYKNTIIWNYIQIVVFTASMNN